MQFLFYALVLVLLTALISIIKGDSHGNTLSIGFHTCFMLYGSCTRINNCLLN
jgi:hypothetical protein